MKAFSQTVALTTLLLVGGVSLAQNPAEDISPERHPNLAAAQKLIREAYNKIGAAQQANDWDMHGHAKKAKDLLDQAAKELKAAAEEANRKGH
jgi:hypothetical protein